MTEMHDVVEMLLNRMRDYPEDFVSEPNAYDIRQTKWQKALSIAQGVATTQEREALEIRLEEAQRVVYMGTALKIMLSDGEDLGKPLKSASHPGILTTRDVRQQMKLSLDQTMQNEYATVAQRQIRDNLMNSGMFK